MAGNHVARRSMLEFDRVASNPQSIAVREHVEAFAPETNVFIEGSRQSAGIQAADCLAGAIAEDYKRGTDWQDYLAEEDTFEASYTSLSKLENDLSEV